MLLFSLWPDLVHENWATGAWLTQNKPHSPCSVFSLALSISSCMRSFFFLSFFALTCSPFLHFLPTLTNSHSLLHRHFFFLYRRECRPSLWQQEGSEESKAAVLFSSSTAFCSLTAAKHCTACMSVCMCVFVLENWNRGTNNSIQLHLELIAFCFSTSRCALSKKIWNTESGNKSLFYLVLIMDNFPGLCKQTSHWMFNHHKICRLHTWIKTNCIKKKKLFL